jgi:NADH-quinone oxidoreductase subunit F
MEKPLTKHIKPDGSQLELKNYVQDGGYQVVRKVLKEMAPADVITE